MAEVRALPDEHLECYRHSAPDVIAKAQAVMKVNPGAVRERGCSGQSDTRCQGSASTLVQVSFAAEVRDEPDCRNGRRSESEG